MVCIAGGRGGDDDNNLLGLWQRRLGGWVGIQGGGG